MKPTIEAKIGTNSKTRIVLWNDKQSLIEGSFILAMEEELYNSLHSSYRRLKTCNYWQNYIVIKNDNLLMLTLI